MRFQLANEVFEPEITDAATVVSRSTGHDLRRLTIRFRTRGSAERKRVDALPTGTTLVSIDDDPPRQWRKVGTSSSMNDGRSPIWLHTWEVEEMEQIAAEALILNELRVVPSRYAEHWLGDRLEVHALVTVNAREHDALKKLAALNEAVTVVRVGVSPESRLMEIHQGPWSERDGSFQWLLRLEDPDDADRKPSAGLLVMRRTHHSVPYLLALFDAMSELLISKGVITEEDSKGVKDRAVPRRGERAVDMLRVDDVEEFWNEEAFTR